MFLELFSVYLLSSMYIKQVVSGNFSRKMNALPILWIQLGAKQVQKLEGSSKEKKFLSRFLEERGRESLGCEGFTWLMICCKHFDDRHSPTSDLGLGQPRAASAAKRVPVVRNKGKHSELLLNELLPCSAISFPFRFICLLPLSQLSFSFFHPFSFLILSPILLSHSLIHSSFWLFHPFSFLILYQCSSPTQSFSFEGFYVQRCKCRGWDQRLKLTCKGSLLI